MVDRNGKCHSNLLLVVAANGHVSVVVALDDRLPAVLAAAKVGRRHVTAAQVDIVQSGVVAATADVLAFTKSLLYLHKLLWLPMRRGGD